MTHRIREYHRPEEATKAHELLARTDVRTKPLSIGPKPSMEPYADVDAVVDFERLGYSFIEQANEGILVGPMTPLQDLIESPLIRSIADGIVSEAAQLTAHLGLRHLATVSSVVDAEDCPPEVRLVFNALEAAYLPLASHRLGASVAIRSRPSLHGALARVARSPRDQAIVAACAVVEADAGICREVRLAVSCPKPVRIGSVEGMLKGKAFTPELLRTASEAVMNEVEPVGDFRGSAEYRREMAGVLARRALEAAWKRANH